MPLTPEAKRLLAETIRGTAQTPEKGLRTRLLRAIHDEADRRYPLSVDIDDAGLTRHTGGGGNASRDGSPSRFGPARRRVRRGRTGARGSADVEARLLAQAES